MKIEIDASLLANTLACLSYQQGFIKGMGLTLDKDISITEDLYRELHMDILNQFEEIEENK